MRTTIGRLAAGVLALAGLYAFVFPAFAQPSYENPDHEALAGEVRAGFAPLTETIIGARDTILDRLNVVHSRVSATHHDLGTISGNLAGARDTILERLDDIQLSYTETLAGARNTILERIDARTAGLSGNVAGARDTILSRLDPLASRTNNYTEWLFVAGATAKETLIDVTVFSPTAQVVQVTHFTNEMQVGPLLVPLEMNRPTVINVNSVVGDGKLVTTKVVSVEGEMFFAERVTRTRHSVDISPGQHN